MLQLSNCALDSQTSSETLFFLMKMAMKNVCLIVSMIYISEIYLSLNPAKTHILRLLCRIKIKFDVVGTVLAFIISQVVVPANTITIQERRHN